MNRTSRPVRAGGAVLGIAVLCASALNLSGCRKAPAAADVPVPTDQPATAGRPTPKDDAGAAEASEGVSLTASEIQKMGIVTAQARTIMHAPEATGFAFVLAHENIASALAELDTAVATEHQSRSALDRTKRLAGTAGAMPADTLETAQRQAAVDRAALELAQRKLSSMFGQDSPWRNQTNSPQLLALARGDAKLVRATFPLGADSDSTPASLRLAHIDAVRSGKSVETHLVWSAPADTGVPGRSYFAYLKTSSFGEGEHLLAWLPMGEAESGILVPASAVVINGGKYWCYVEEKPGQFVRNELDPAKATAEGYFVKAGIDADAKIVTVSAGQLLAREINPSTAAE